MPQSASPKLPTLRFRGKIVLGFAAVLVISATSLGIAWLGFERVSIGVMSYRHSVAEADLARNIDRELISYRSLARYYVVTGKEDDAKAALTAEASLKDAILQSMKGSSNPARIEQIVKLEREFRIFTKIFADILKVKRESALLTQNQLTRGGTMLRYKFDDLASNAAEAELPAVELGAKQVTSQYLSVIALANTFVINSDQTVASSALARLKFVENSLRAISSTDEKIVAAIKEISGMLDEYRQSLGKLVDNAKSIDELVAEMADSAAAITQGSNAMKADLLSDQQRLENESDATVHETERLVTLLAAGGFILGGLLALMLGKGISRPMIAMCKAMRELAGGNFDVVLPGLGRRDELGEMAAAVEEFKLQAIAKAERDAAAHEAQNRAASEARRAELIRFADNFETAVGAIVSNVSASAVQLESAAGTLTRTAEITEDLSGQVAGASEEASTNMQAVAAATEELSQSVDEIGRRVRESNRIAEGAVLQALETDARIGKLTRAAQQIGDVVKLITAIAEQTNLLGAQCHHRGRPRRRGRPRFCGGRSGSEIAGQPDRKGDRRNLLAHRRDAGRDPGIGHRHQGDRPNHRADFEDRVVDCQRSGAAKLGDPGDCAQRPKRRARHAGSRRQHHESEPRRHRNRNGFRRGAEFGADPVHREHAAASGTGPVHDHDPGGVILSSPRRRSACTHLLAERPTPPHPEVLAAWRASKDAQQVPAAILRDAAQARGSSG